MVYLDIAKFLNHYGLVFMFIIILIEYLNIPGFPAGVIYPAIGLWSKVSNIPIAMVITLSVIAGVIGSITLYCIGMSGGEQLLRVVCSRSNKLNKKIQFYESKLRSANFTAIFSCTLIPVIRTIIPFVAGATKVEFRNYIIPSLLGITLWNVVLLYFGLVFGNIAL